MENTKLLKKLTNLAQLDVDAIKAYEIAIEKISVADIKHNLNLFKVDHERHVKEINHFISKLGGEEVTDTLDFKGLLIGGMTFLRSAMGTEGALKAMCSNEETTNKTYDEALSENSIPDNIRVLLEKNRDDERKHLKYIQNQLQNIEKHS